MHLAQINIAKLVAPLGDDEVDEFERALDPINALGEASPGFLWRLVGDGADDATDVRLPGIDDDLLIVNMSVWTDLESLQHFVYRSGHAQYLRRKREWFSSEPLTLPSHCLWWISEGHEPTINEAVRQLQRLADHGPTASAFTLNKPFAAPTAETDRL